MRLSTLSITMMVVPNRGAEVLTFLHSSWSFGALNMAAGPLVLMIDMSSARSPLPVPAFGASMSPTGLCPLTPCRITGVNTTLHAVARLALSTNGKSNRMSSIMSAA